MKCYTVFVCVFVLYLHQGEALKCYNCTSVDNPDCINPTDLTKVPTEECIDEVFDDFTCHQYVLLLKNGTSYVFRGCSGFSRYVNVCSANHLIHNMKITSCSICDSDLCNTS